MPALREMGHLMLADCAVHPLMDPCPNEAGPVAAAMEGSGAVVQMRCPGRPQDVDAVIDAAARPGVRLCIKYGWPGDARKATALYEHAAERLVRAYGRRR